MCAEVKYNRRYKVRCIARENRVETVDIGTSATTVQNSIMCLILLASVQQRYHLIITNIENAYLNAETSEKVFSN